MTSHHPGFIWELPENAIYWQTTMAAIYSNYSVQMEKIIMQT